MKKLALLFALACTSAYSAPNYGELSFTDGGRNSEGNQLIGLTIDLNEAEHWKTYWRIAGQNGLSPIFNFDESENIGSIKTYWPEPKIIGTKGVEAVGYTDNITIVFEITPENPDTPVSLDLTLDLGVCQNICVPVHEEFSSELNAGYSIDAASLQLAKLEAFDDGEFCERGSVRSDAPTLIEIYEDDKPKHQLNMSNTAYKTGLPFRAYIFENDSITRHCDAVPAK